MSTDTAVLVTKVITEDGRPFEEIPFVDDPEVFHKTTEGIDESIEVTGFRYVQDCYDWETEKFGEGV